jgi:hypothetical protein
MHTKTANLQNGVSNHVNASLGNFYFFVKGLASKRADLDGFVKTHVFLCFCGCCRVHGHRPFVKIVGGIFDALP